MDINTILNPIYENINIFIGIFVSLAIMGSATLYDNYKKRDEPLFKSGEPGRFSGLNKIIIKLKFRGLNNLSEFKEKISSPLQKKLNKNKPEKKKRKSLKPAGLQKFIGNLKNKISSISLTLPGKGKKRSGEKSILSSKAKTSNPEETDNDFNKVIESKMGELDYEEDLLTEMPAVSGLKGKGHEASTLEPLSDEMSGFDASLNSDLVFDDSEFDVGFGDIDSESSEEDLSFNDDPFNDNFEDINFEDESDSLLASLKNDIVIRKEERIDFMAEMRGENLDLKLLKSELEDVLKELKKHRQYT